MANSQDNRKRAFADVVSVDAWHDEFGKQQKVDLHADVVFGTGRIGGETNSPVRFRLSIKRAEVVIVTPETEPVAIDPSSVSRDTPALVGHSKQTISKKMGAGIEGEGALSFSPISVKGRTKVKVNGKFKQQARSKLKISSPIKLMIVTQSKTSDGNYRWFVEPQISGALSGKPWDALEEPRLKLIDKRKDRTKGIAPSVRIEVRCRREDLLIHDLHVKDEGIWERAKNTFGFKNKMAAAISYIRDKLCEEGLEVQNIEDEFGLITLGMATAQPIQKI